MPVMIDSGLRDLAAKLAMVGVRMLSLTLLLSQTTIVARSVIANSNMLWLWDQASVREGYLDQVNTNNMLTFAPYSAFMRGARPR